MRCILKYTQQILLNNIHIKNNNNKITITITMFGGIFVLIFWRIEEQTNRRIDPPELLDEVIVVVFFLAVMEMGWDRDRDRQG